MCMVTCGEISRFIADLVQVESFISLLNPYYHISKFFLREALICYLRPKYVIIRKTVLNGYYNHCT